MNTSPAATPAAAPWPALYISHGSPMIALHPGAAGLFMQRLGPAIEALWGKPRAIVVVSPHTASHSPVILGAARHEAIHDFGGFPEALFRMRYDAPGEPAVARQALDLLKQAGIDAQWSDKGGLDHGIWTVMRHMWPQADVPLVPLSLTPQATPAQILAMGRALAPLAAQGVLLMGTGSLTHNLQRLFGQDTPEDALETPDCAAFRAWVLARTQAGDWLALKDYRAQAPHAPLMHPTDEHWLPFFFAGGAAMPHGESGSPLAVRLHGSVTYGHLAMDCYAFGEGAQDLSGALPDGSSPESGTSPI